MNCISEASTKKASNIPSLTGKTHSPVVPSCVPIAIPLDPLFSFIYEPFTWQNGIQYWEILYSYGIKEMLVGFIYFEIMKDSITMNTLAGSVAQKSENSTGAITTIYGKYNDAVKTYQAIQTYIIYNSGSYPSFRGNSKQYAHWL